MQHFLNQWMASHAWRIQVQSRCTAGFLSFPVGVSEWSPDRSLSVNLLHRLTLNGLLTTTSNTAGLSSPPVWSLDHRASKVSIFLFLWRATWQCGTCPTLLEPVHYQVSIHQALFLGMYDNGIVSFGIVLSFKIT